MTKGKIAYLVWEPDYNEEDYPIDGEGTWTFKEQEPSYGIIKKIVYFEVE